MIKKVSRNVVRQRRHARVRKTVSGTPECPRLNVFRSNKHIHVQVIDDVNGVTLASASSVNLKLKMVEILKLLKKLVRLSLKLARQRISKMSSSIVADISIMVVLKPWQKQLVPMA